MADRMIRWIGTAAALAGIVALAPAVAGGQAGPTLTATPMRTGVNQPVEVTVTGCTTVVPEGPEVSVSHRFDDVLDSVRTFTEDPAGVWKGTVSSGGTDMTLRLSCDGAEREVVVDVDNPLMYPMPWVVLGSLPDPPESFLGTDCPDGTSATVVFAPAGLAEVIQVADIDSFGDWSVDVPELPDTTSVTVTAGCGSVTYPETSYVDGGTEATTTTTTEPTTTTSPPPAAPANAVAGAPGYTG